MLLVGGGLDDYLTGCCDLSGMGIMWIVLIVHIASSYALRPAPTEPLRLESPSEPPRPELASEPPMLAAVIVPTELMGLVRRCGRLACRACCLCVQFPRVSLDDG